MTKKGRRFFPRKNRVTPTLVTPLLTVKLTRDDSGPINAMICTDRRNRRIFCETLRLNNIPADGFNAANATLQTSRPQFLNRRRHRRI